MFFTENRSSKSECAIFATHSNDMEELLVNHNNGITTITLNRPAVFNSFNRSMALALHAALDNAANDEAVRCIVLTGEGRAF